jgi:L-methionine (R)-S-oxide reductase
MAEDLKIILNGTKTEQYRSLVSQIKALVELETDVVANMANICAALKEQFNFLWIGFYLVKGKELVLGPFQGPVACTRIAYGKGVCGEAWAQKKVIMVSDVETFPGHISCSSLSKSEIVVPVMFKNEVIAVLDIDSARLDSFDEIDRQYLSQIIEMISDLFHSDASR